VKSSYHAREGPLEIIEVEVAHHVEGERKRDARRGESATRLAMDPFTPRPRVVGRKNNLSLSTKEYAKVRTIHVSQDTTFFIVRRQVTGTIASARRNRHRLEGEEQTNGRVSPSGGPRWRGA
jgi:hypothetical protein